MTTAALATVLALGSAQGLEAEGDPASSETYPVIAQLVLRDRRLRISATPDGHRYTLAEHSGEILSANLTAAQLAERHPDLAELLQPAIADENVLPGLMMLAPVQH
ncbi:MAG: hypothetical protein HC838_09800 [Spirulinaceae cyanobacterium RM2_2_10]|nr:hypothetical protein [Spirulinaceae cyanobacterium SM2_1_0]NJO20266.1 hypothetical protein [Spirulinaceae cyanobacterium RM2_2_10]